MQNHRLRILAFSDLHGACLREAGQLIDEMRPDFSMISGRESRLDAQRRFWETYRSTFVRDFAVTTLVRGNHEIEGFSDPGLRALPLAVAGHVARLEGIPAEFGAWGWSREWEEEELEAEFREQLREVPAPRVFVSHVPPYGCLDGAVGGEHIGHRLLAAHLHDRDWPEVLVLCGHVHESFGCMEFGQTLVVNAACGYALVEWRLGTATVFRQERLRPRRETDRDF